MMNFEEYVQRLIECTDKKFKLLQEVFELTRKQSGNIVEDGLEALQNHIDEKQKVIDEINKTDEAFNVYFQRIKQVMKVNKLEEIDQPGNKGIKYLQEKITEVTKLMTEISSLEKQNNDKAKELLDFFAGEIKKVNVGKKVNTAYSPGNSLQPPSYFIDKKK